MIDPLVAAFEACTLPPANFHHEQHVYVVWCYLQEMPLAEAAARFRESLRRYANSLGKTTLYHETITWAYVILTNERMQRAPSADWESFRAANGDLLTWQPSILQRYYRPETLSSDFARQTFVMPDLVYEELR